MAEQRKMKEAATKFYNHFKKIKDKKVAIYGLGANTEAILQDSCTEDFNIVGLMDGYKTGGEFMGRRILSIEELSPGDLDAVIIVARAGSTHIIYNRIKRKMEQLGTDIYSFDGKKMSDTSRYAEHPGYSGVGLNTVKKAVEDRSVISFDLFDTMIMRKVLLPADIFSLVEQKNKQIPSFASIRFSAERDLQKNGNPNLEEIYKRIHQDYGYGKALLEQYMEDEMDIDQRCMVIRQDMKRLYDFCLERDKKVYFVTDMYYSQDYLKKILYGFGIHKYEKLIISSDYGMRKEDGLFDVLIQEAGTLDILHIGDNEAADICAAQKAGLAAVRVSSAYELLNMSSMKEIAAYTETLNERILVGILAEKIFNSPFALYGSNGFPSIKSSVDYAEIFIAPVCLALISWLIQASEEDDYILFAARDGYLIYSLYQKIMEKSGCRDKGTYFLTSRAAGIGAMLTDEDDIVFASKIAYSGNKKDFLRERFHVDMDYEGNLLAYKEQILKIAKKKRSGYKKYISRLQIEQRRNIAFFDLVSSGTCQAALEKITGKKLHGVYLLKIKDQSIQKNKLKADALYGTADELDSSTSILAKYFILEKILTSDSPTLKEFDEEGNPVFYQESRHQDEIQILKKMQQSILDYAEENLWLFEFEKMCGMCQLIDKIFSYADLQHVRPGKEIEKFFQYNLVDEFCQRELILQESST